MFSISCKYNNYIQPTLVWLYLILKAGPAANFLPHPTFPRLGSSSPEGIPRGSQDDTSPESLQPQASLALALSQTRAITTKPPRGGSSALLSEPRAASCKAPSLSGIGRWLQPGTRTSFPRKPRDNFSLIFLQAASASCSFPAARRIVG